MMASMNGTHVEHAGLPVSVGRWVASYLYRNGTSGSVLVTCDIRTHEQQLHVSELVLGVYSRN